MFRRLCLPFALAAVGFLLTPDAAHAFGRRSAGHASCWEPCYHYCEPCHVHCPPCWPTLCSGWYYDCCCCRWEYVYVYCYGHCHIHHWCCCYIPKYCRWGCVWIDRCYYGNQAAPGAPAATPSATPAPEGAKPTGGAAATPASATLVVDLPADAKLNIQGTATTAAGARRVFTSPALTPGVDYSYVLTAEYVRDGRPQSVTRTVAVRAGGVAEVSFDAPATALAAR